jgi:hypothetical protein
LFHSLFRPFAIKHQPPPDGGRKALPAKLSCYTIRNIKENAPRFRVAADFSFMSRSKGRGYFYSFAKKRLKNRKTVL